jgi:hypothetical protein
MNVNEELIQITRRLNHENVRYEVHTFDSGCAMVDIWKDDLFYVIQLERERIGLSLVDENADLSTIPDKTYNNFENFMIDFEKIFKLEK